MSRLPDTVYENYFEREAPRAIDKCIECGYDIYYGEEYYDIYGKIICEECIEHLKKTGGEDE